MKNIFKNIALVLSVLAVSTIVGYAVLAWVGPGGTPPNSNADMPINVSGAPQTKSGGLNIMSNVGIGTTVPGSKLSVYRAPSNTVGQTALGFDYNGTLDLWGFRMSPGTFDLNIDREYAGWSATPAMTFQRFTGNVGIGTTNPDQKMDVAGYVKGQTGLCIGDQCCNSWAKCIELGGGICKIIGADCSNNNECCSSLCTAGKCEVAPITPTCGGTMASCTTGTQCCSGVCSGNFCTSYHPCVKDVLPSGAKRIFVTSKSYLGDFRTGYNPKPQVAALDINAYCQSVAAGAGLTGTYRALAHFNYYVNATQYEYNPNNALSASSSFWVGKENITSNDCDWTMIAGNASGMFEITGIATPIGYDETGAPSAANVWTNFKPTRGGSYTTLTNMKGEGMCYCLDSSGGFPYPIINQDYSESWTGNAAQKDIRWAYTLRSWNWANIDHPCDKCQETSRALYCVEQ